MGLAGPWAAVVLAACVACGTARYAPDYLGTTGGGTPQDQQDDAAGDFLQVGRSLNLLPRYGFLTLSVKVFPHRSDNDWLFREQTAEVFEKNSYWSAPDRFRQQYRHPRQQGRGRDAGSHHPRPPRNDRHYDESPEEENVESVGPSEEMEEGSSPRQPRRHRTDPPPSQVLYGDGKERDSGDESQNDGPLRRQYDQHFLIDFCDDARDLLTAYFDNFYIEGVPEPKRAFTSSLSTKNKAQHLGIHATFLSNEYSFVLVRLFRRKQRATLAGDLNLAPHFKTTIGYLRAGSRESVNQFLDHYGTHVITEYEVGDVMYQVYVFGARTYGELKNNFAMSQSSQTELSRMERYFTPYYALHVGKVKLASGNPNFEKVVGDQLMSMTFFRLYQSIFTIFKDQDLEKKLEELDGEVVLSLKLEKITKIVPKSPERHWLREILDNTLNLYYVTM